MTRSIKVFLEKLRLKFLDLQLFSILTKWWAIELFLTIYLHIHVVVQTYFELLI